MILEALNSAISGVCNTYPMVGDIEATTPFAVYNVMQNVLRDKSGIVGYQYDVSISVVDPDIDTCMTKSSGIKVAVDALEDTTVQDTTFDIVHFRSEAQRYDAVAFNYINDMEYSITTQNI
jgi:hypothetical protein